MSASRKTIARARQLIADGYEPRQAAEMALREQAADRGRRPTYREAIKWMVYNDDTEWAQDHSGEKDAEALSSISVTGAMVRDLFGKTDERVRQDVRAGLRKAGRIA